MPQRRGCDGNAPAGLFGHVALPGVVPCAGAYGLAGWLKHHMQT